MARRERERQEYEENGVSIRQHSSAYVSIRQHASVVRQHTSAYGAKLPQEGGVFAQQQAAARGCSSDLARASSRLPGTGYADVC
jgi:hypothetical protein